MLVAKMMAPPLAELCYIKSKRKQMKDFFYREGIEEWYYTLYWHINAEAKNTFISLDQVKNLPGGLY